MNFGKFFAVMLAIAPLQIAEAQTGQQVCESVYKNSTRNITKSAELIEAKHDLFSRHCQADGSTKSSTLDFNVAYKALDLGLGHSSDSDKHSKFCKENSEVYRMYVRNEQYDNRVTVAALQSFNDCMEIASLGMSISHTMFGNESVVFAGNFHKDDFEPTIESIIGDDTVTCSSVSFSADGLRETIDGSRLIETRGENWRIQCDREPEKDGETLVYTSTVVGISTSSGDYSVTLPASTRLGFRDAERLYAMKDDADAKTKQMIALMETERDRANQVHIRKWARFSTGDYDRPALFSPRLDARNGIPSSFLVAELNQGKTASTLLDDYSKYVCGGTDYSRYRVRSAGGDSTGYNDYVVACYDRSYSSE